MFLYSWIIWINIPACNKNPYSILKSSSWIVIYFNSLTLSYTFFCCFLRLNCWIKRPNPNKSVKKEDFGNWIKCIVKAVRTNATSTYSVTKPDDVAKKPGFKTIFSFSCSLRFHVIFIIINIIFFKISQNYLVNVFA